MRNILSRERSIVAMWSGLVHSMTCLIGTNLSTSRACFGWNRRVFIVVADDDPISWPIIIFVNDMTSCPKMEIFSF